MKKSGTLLVTALVTLGVAQSGSAASIEICVNGVCPTTTVGPLFPTVGEQIVFSVGLEAEEATAGYELFFSYDPTKLELVSSANTFPIPGLFPFTVDPLLCADPSNCRAAALQLSSFATTSLFTITANVIGVLEDGQVILEVFAGGLAGNPAPGIDNFPVGIGKGCPGDDCRWLGAARDRSPDTGPPDRGAPPGPASQPARPSPAPPPSSTASSPFQPSLQDHHLVLSFATTQPPVSFLMPEPGTLVLLAAGMVGLALHGRRRRRA
jgi:hypothetical protein